MALIVLEDFNGTRGFICGGILINKRYVLTTIICTSALLDTDVKVTAVRLGEYNTKTDPDCIRSSRGVKCAPSPIDVDVEEQIEHERSVIDAESNKIVFDIALLRLKKEVEFTETIRPICLLDTPEERSKTYVGQRLTVTGWIKTADDLETQTFIKRKIQIPVTDREICKSNYNKINLTLSDDQFCAGGEEGRGVCIGDYGNPVMVATADEKAKVNWHLVGIVSLGVRDCGVKDVPAIFTNISVHIPWILNKLRP